jgi:hypothetical protein
MYTKVVVSYLFHVYSLLFEFKNHGAVVFNSGEAKKCLRLQFEKNWEKNLYEKNLN